MTLTHICGVHRLSVTTLSSLRMIFVAFTQGETAAAVCSSLLPLLGLYLVTQRLQCSLTTFTSSPSSVCYDGRNRMNVDIMNHIITLSGWFSPLTFMMSKKPGNPSTVMLVIQNSVPLHWQLCAYSESECIFVCAVQQTGCQS